MKFIKNIFKKKEKPKQEGKKFSSKVRVNGDKMTDKEKMDKGFDGKTYSLNGIDLSFASSITLSLKESHDSSLLV